MKFPWKQFLLFLLLNFGALALGSWLMGDPATNEWYQRSDKAPWTPPGWMFGAAWFTIMALFALFMAFVLGKSRDKKKWIILYSAQWILNVSWNPLFFQLHMSFTGMIVLIVLLIILAAMFTRSLKIARPVSLLLMPYMLWMCVAISMDAYLWYMN